MRNKLILKAVGVILLVISVSFSASALMNGNSDGNTITIHNVSHELQGGPRSVVPFYAEYNDLMNTVMLGCSDSLGDVTVTLESTAGDWYQTRRDVILEHNYIMGFDNLTPYEEWLRYLYIGPPYFAYMKMNWGWASQWTSGTNDCWFAPTSSWLTTNGEYAYGRHMYYGFYH